MPDPSEPTSDRSRGLSAAGAARRLQTDGPNELPGQRPRNLLAIGREVLTEPMFLLLIVAASIYVVLGDVREATVLASSIVIVVFVTILQAQRMECALAALRDLLSPRALVIRNGAECRIAGTEVVVGDIVLLREGDRVPADGILLDATALSVDESILTGESLSVDKAPAVTRTGGRTDLEHARLHSGSLVVRGFGMTEITATGLRSEIGKIGQSLTTQTGETTPLMREVRRLLVKPNPIYWWIVIGTSVALAVTVYVPTIADVFRFAPPAFVAATVVVAAAASLVLAGGLLLRPR